MQTDFGAFYASNSKGKADLATWSRAGMYALPLPTTILMANVQILLDLQRLKGCLLQLPKLAGEGTGTSSALTSYNRVVAKSIGRLDIMLQVIMSPESPPEGFVDHYLVLIPCQSFSDFQKMLDLKGVRRMEQNNLLDIFLAKTSLLRDLADTSVLSGIEMDNNAGNAQNVQVATTGLNFQGIMPTSPNSALAHNLNLLMGSLPMLQSSTSSSSAGPSSRTGTPHMGFTGSDQGRPGLNHSATLSFANDAKAFGFKKIGRLFSNTSSTAS